MKSALYFVTPIILLIIFLLGQIGLTYYQYCNMLIKLLTGIAPFAAAFGAYYMWSKNRKKLDYKNDYYKINN